MSYCYIIGGVGFDFALENELVEYSPYDVFRVDRESFPVSGGHHFHFFNEKYTLPLNCRLISSTDSVDIYETESEYIHVNKRFDEIEYTCTLVSPKNKSGGAFYCSIGNFDKIKVTAEFLRCCDFVSSLLFYDAMILHCSYIIHDGKAILFSAPSEGGKSTQAALWEKYQGAEIINGDRAVVKKEKDGWYVYSLPFCGSSRICKNKKAPLSTIAFVNKAEKNIVENISNVQKLKLLMSQLTFESKKRDNFCKVFTLVDNLITNVKIVKLNCRIDEEATEVLRKETAENE